MKRYKPTVTGSLGTSLLWHFPCRKEKRQNVSGFSDGRRRTEVARARQGLVGVGGRERNWGGRGIQSTLSTTTTTTISFYYLHDYNKELQYCNSYLY